MKKFIFFSGLFIIVNFGYSQQINNKENIVVHPSVIKTGTFLGETPPLRDILPEEDLNKLQQLKQQIKKKRKDLQFELNPEMKIRKYPFIETALPKGSDPVLQSEMGKSKATIQVIKNFDGQSNTMFPQDCNGTVGQNHFMQTINLTYTIYNKNGNLVAGPTNLNTIFSGVTGSSCNDGDPIILYDENAQRWLFAEFSLCGSNDYMLIAVSTTNDPTGTWYKYSFDVDDVPDYMKFGIWRDGYYMATNNSSGKDVYVFQRDVMLSGGSSPKMVGFDNPNRPNSGFHCIMPLDNDWAFAPAGTPGLFITINDDAWGGSDQLWIYELAVNWTNTSSSTFQRVQTINVPAFSSYFGSSTWDDITQPGTTQKLDGIPTVLMFRAQYVNFGTEERIVCNHTVNVGSNRAGIRWYELVRQSGSSTWSIRQNGTYAPSDGLNRWCAGISINQNKEIGLIYNVTGTTGGTNIYPGIRIAAQSSAANAAANGTIDVPEVTIINGVSYQSSANRWGDYTQLSVDPSDGITFWGTISYVGSTDHQTKKTKIVAFKLSSDDNPQAFTATAVSSSQINLSWQLNQYSNPVLIVYNTTNTFGTPVNGTTYNVGQTINGGGTVIYKGSATSFQHTGLNAATTYYYKAFSILTGNNYSSGVTAQATTFMDAFSLDFEACSDWSTNFAPWVNIDGDGKNTYQSADCNFTGEGTAFGFMAFNPSLAGCFSTHGGQRCGVAICPSDASQANNWLISDAIHMHNGGSISFWVQSPKPGTWGNETYQVLVSTTNQNTSSFTAIATNETAPSTWTQKTYNLSDYANQTIYIAIRHISIDKFMFFIDDIVIDTGTVSGTPPVADFVGTPITVTAGQNVTFTDLSINNPTSWQWQFPGGIPSTSTQQNPVVTYNTPGVYDVTLIVSNQYGSDTLTKTGYIIVNQPSGGFSLDFEACSDWSTNFTPWLNVDVDNKSTYQSADCNFTGEGTAFAFMAFNPSLAGCFSTHGGQRCGVAICPSDASQANNWLISPAIPMYNNGSISFWVQSPKPGTWGNETYQVLVSITNQNTASFTAIAPNETAPSTWTQKTYNLSQYNNQTIYIAIRHNSTDKFMFFIDDIVINQGTQTLPEAQFTIQEGNSVCAGSTIHLINQSTNASDYLWIFENGSPSTSTQQNPTVTYTTPGTYNITLVASYGAYSDTIIQQVTVLSNPQVTITSNNTTICNGQSSTLTASGANTYIWSSNLGTQTQVSVSPSSTMNYYVTGTAANGCTSTASITITVNPAPQIILQSNSPVCEGDTLNIYATINQDYTWQGPGGSIYTGSTIIIPSTATVNSGVYYVTATNSYGCTATSSISCVVNALPDVVANASSVLICEGQNLTLYGSGATSYVWSNGVNNDVPFVPTTSQTYYVTGTDANGCTNTASIYVSVSPSFTLTAQVTNSSGYDIPDGSIDLTITDGVSPYTIQWSNGSADEDLIGILPGTYTVNVTNADGCVTSLTVEVGYNSVNVVNVSDEIALLLYPNPAKNEIILKIKATEIIFNVEIFIEDINGMLIQKIINNPSSKSLEQKIKISSVSNGIYFIKALVNSKYVWVGKFIKR